MIAERVQHISPFIVMEVLEKAAEMERRGEKVIHLEVGEPDFSVPQCIFDAVKKAFSEQRTHYTHSPGAPELVCNCTAGIRVSHAEISAKPVYLCEFHSAAGRN